MADGKVPDQVGAVSLTDGCTTATFSWSAPANGGLPITKYGWQYSTDSGSNWSAETETASTSSTIDVNNNTNSYVVRVRAFNSLGWGAYSAQSSATTAWTYESYSDSASCTDASDCDSCGTKTGTKYRTCYRYVRSGCTTTSGLSCGAYGSCTDLGSCSGSWVDNTSTGTYNGVHYTYTTDFLGEGSYVYQTSNPYNGCSSAGPQEYYCYTITYCSVTSSYRVNAVGCIRVTFK